MRATALVIDADPPVSGARWGDGRQGMVTILVDDGSNGPICVARRLRLGEDRWLVRGMEIPVSIDPARPERFEIEWDAIPSIEARTAANDSTLADPRGTRRKLAAALASAGVSGPALGPRSGGMAADPVGNLRRNQPADRLEEMLREAAERPAPPGKQRAVVVVSTITSGGDTSSGPSIDPNTNGPP